jgi:glucokinase
MKGDIIAVDLGGTHLRTALVRNNQVVKYIRKDTPKEKKALVREIVWSISQLMNKDIVGIGVASPGPLKNGVILNPPNLPLRYFNLKRFLIKIFSVPVEIENDPKCVAIAESKLGCKKKHFFILTLGTGIGGGVIINNDLYIGSDYGAELGGIILDDGRELEDLWKDHRRLAEKYFGKVMLMNDLFKMKDPRAKQIIEDATKYLGQGIASLINVFDPEVVILAGGVKETGRKFLRMVKKNTYPYVRFPKKIKIRWTKLDHPGTLGASLLIK